MYNATLEDKSTLVTHVVNQTAPRDPNE
jgi:hypothetical protein